uniref:Uncharacterized protein n=1 Tax=Myotis myotis TaxID=51298 RepID=A0A7J7R0K5_MYOMY|nr:hypothetical protein mMyoMyo1_011230 [Myotis myotis]
MGRGVVTGPAAAHRPRSGCSSRGRSAIPFGKSVRLPWPSASAPPNTPASPAPPTAAASTAPAAPSSDSGRRCRTARTACRPRSRRRGSGAPRGRAGTRRRSV